MSPAKSSSWWPELSNQLDELVTNCTTCARERHIHAEPMIPSGSMLRPGQNVATDMFVYKGRTYLLVVDYSIYVEIAKLDTLASSNVFNHLKSIFARHGIPETLVSDNGPQFSVQEFVKFTEGEGGTCGADG